MSNNVTIEEMEIIVRAKVDEALKPLNTVMKKLDAVNKKIAAPMKPVMSAVVDGGALM